MEATGGLMAWIYARRARRQQQQGIVECALRDRTGSISPLLRRWRHGRARLEPGAITFEPFVGLGFRMRRPRTNPIRVEVCAVGDCHRVASGMERLTFRGVVFPIETADGPLEWGLAPLTDIQWATERVGSAHD